MQHTTQPECEDFVSELEALASFYKEAIRVLAADQARQEMEHVYEPKAACRFLFDLGAGLRRLRLYQLPSRLPSRFVRPNDRDCRDRNGNLIWLVADWDGIDANPLPDTGQVYIDADSLADIMGNPDSGASEASDPPGESG
jgi:hypothetical protein